MSRAVLSEPEVAVATRVIAAVAPAEQPLLSQLMEPRPFEFLRRPGAVGYGVEDIVHVASPYVMVGVAWAWAVVVNDAKAEAEKRIKRVYRRAFGRSVDSPKALEVQSSPATEADVRSLVLDRLVEIGCAPEEAISLSRVISREVIAEFQVTRPRKHLER